MTCRSASTSGGRSAGSDSTSHRMSSPTSSRACGQPGVVRRVLPRREGVHLAADGVDGLGDLARRALLGALEQQVLQEVRGARQLGRLVSSADADPGTEADRTGLRHRLGDDAEAVGQLGLLDARVQQVGHGVGQRRPPRRPRSPPRRSPPRPPPSVAAGPRSPNSWRTSASKVSSKDTTSRVAAPGRADRSRRPSRAPLAIAAAAAARDGAVRDLDRGRQAERHLAVRVDVVDLHLDLVAEVEARPRPCRCACRHRSWRCAAGRRGPGGCSRTHRTW